MLELTILGCGSSVGVPIIGCKCNTCKSTSPYNKRLRSSIIIRSDTTNILVDFGWDVREQLIRENIDKIDGVILTHFHADHVSGFDDLRVFKIIHGKKFDLYTDQRSLEEMKDKFGYILKSDIANLYGVDFYSKVKVGDIELQLFRQDHGTMNSIGIRIGDVVYTNDVIGYPEESKEYMRDARVIIMDCVGYQSMATHSGLDQVMKWQQDFNPQQIYLTNMSHKIDYFEVSKNLPSNIAPSYDGMKVIIEG